MATQHQHRHQRLPPTPPPSPPRRRHKKKKSDDPFLSPPSDVENEEPQEPEPESPITRLLLTPILMTSFLLSLFWVNRSDRARRAASAPTPTSSFISYLTPPSWLDPEPYQEPSTSAWGHRNSVSSAHHGPHESLNVEERRRNERADAAASQEKENQKKGWKGWFLRKKIRKVARVEIADAFELRKRVIVLMVAVAVAAFLGVVLGLRWILRLLLW